MRRDLTFLEEVSARAYACDFFALLRKLECAAVQAEPKGHGQNDSATLASRIGSAVSVRDEVGVFSQALVTRPITWADSRHSLTLSFAPSSIFSIRRAGEGTIPYQIETRFFGLLGPTGPMPLSIVAFIHFELLMRSRRVGKREPLTALLDWFNHRFLSYLYRAWALSRPTVSLDRPADDYFSSYIAALAGAGSAEVLDRDSIPRYHKLHFAGLLGRQVKNARGLEAILRAITGLPVQIREFKGHWLPIPRSASTVLSGNQGALGRAIGGRTWTIDTKVRICIGALPLEGYRSLLPFSDGSRLRAVRDWIRNYLGLDCDWDLLAIISENQPLSMKLGRNYGARLGFTSWLMCEEAEGAFTEVTRPPERARVVWSEAGVDRFLQRELASGYEQ